MKKKTRVYESYAKCLSCGCSPNCPCHVRGMGGCVLHGECHNQKYSKGSYKYKFIDDSPGISKGDTGMLGDVGLYARDEKTGKIINIDHLRYSMTGIDFISFAFTQCKNVIKKLLK